MAGSFCPRREYDRKRTYDFREVDFWSNSSALNELKEHFAKAGEDMVNVIKLRKQDKTLYQLDDIEVFFCANQVL